MNAKQAIVITNAYHDTCFPDKLIHTIDKRECVFLFYMQRMHEVVVEPMTTLQQSTELPDPCSPFLALIHEMYKQCQLDTIDTPYMTRKRIQYHIPYFESRNNPDAWNSLAFIDRVNATMLFCASLFTADPNVEESCFDVDECHIILTAATQHPHFDICHLLYSELLVEHLAAVAQSHMIEPRESSSPARHENMMQIRRSLFQHRTIKLNNMLLTCMLLAMHPAMAVRNFVTYRPPDNEVFAEKPAFACDLSYMSVPTGEPRQIVTLKCDIVSQFIHFVELLRQGSMFANSSTIEALLFSDSFQPGIEGSDHDVADDDYIGASVLFSHRPTLTKGILWIALLVELMPPDRTRFLTQYLFLPHAQPKADFTLIVLAHDKLAIELPTGELIPYTDPVALAVDCAYYLRHGI